ncbi:MAG: hypothetical protein ACYC3X_26350, partial [Pirellulaceae bacterium]
HILANVAGFEETYQPCAKIVPPAQHEKVFPKISGIGRSPAERTQLRQSVWRAWHPLPGVAI